MLAYLFFRLYKKVYLFWVIWSVSFCSWLSLGGVVVLCSQFFDMYFVNVMDFVFPSFFMSVWLGNILIHYWSMLLCVPRSVKFFFLLVFRFVKWSSLVLVRLMAFFLCLPIMFPTSFFLFLKHILVLRKTKYWGND